MKCGELVHFFSVLSHVIQEVASWLFAGGWCKMCCGILGVVTGTTPRLLGSAVLSRSPSF